MPTSFGLSARSLRTTRMPMHPAVPVCSSRSEMPPRRGKFGSSSGWRNWHPCATPVRRWSPGVRGVMIALVRGHVRAHAAPPGTPPTAAAKEKSFGMKCRRAVRNRTSEYAGPPARGGHLHLAELFLDHARQFEVLSTDHGRAQPLTHAGAGSLESSTKGRQSASRSAAGCFPRALHAFLDRDGVPTGVSWGRDDSWSPHSARVGVVALSRDGNACRRCRPWPACRA